MRLFIAIELSEEIKNHLRKLQKDLTKIKASFVKDFHLTLKFLGEVDENETEKIEEKLSKIKFEPFFLKLTQLGVFPNDSYIKVVWAGIGPEDKITDLQKKVEVALEGFRFKNDFKFKPHLTLARVKFIDDKTAFIEKIEQLELKPLEFEVNSFSLMKSNLTTEGPVYEELEKFQPKPL